MHLKEIDIVIIGSGMAGTVLANELVNSKHSVIVLESGNTVAPYNDNKIFQFFKSNLRFTRGMGNGGTTNFWHSGLIKLPKNNKWARENIYDGNWYEKAINHLNIKNICVIGTEEIYYPKKRIRLKIDNSEILRTGVAVQKIDPVRKLINYIQHGVSYELGYKVLIVCAGGIGTPLLLKNEYNSDEFNQIQIGENLCDHFTFPVAKVKLSKWKFIKFSSATSHGTLKKGYSIQDDETNLSHLFVTRPAFTARKPKNSTEIKSQLLAIYATKNYLEFFKLIFKNLDFLFEILAYKITYYIPVRYIQFNVVAEQVNINNNKIVYEQKMPKIYWKISDVEIKAAYRSFNKLLESLKDIDSVNFFAFDNNYSACCHHTGTARMTNGDNLGTVNKDFSIRGMNDIYICDGSVIPCSGFANTGLTIIAMSIKLSSIIKDKLATAS